MSVTDPIADMLARIHNATMVKHQQAVMPHSEVREAIARILKEEGFITNYEVIPATPQPSLRVILKYTQTRRPRPVITGLKRVSRPGRRVYAGFQELPWVRSGLGVAIVSTPRGVMTGQQARRMRVGGEVLCYVW
jgi:small subunit ribosomal protein S8